MEIPFVEISFPITVLAVNTPVDILFVFTVLNCAEYVYRLVVDIFCVLVKVITAVLAKKLLVERFSMRSTKPVF